MPDSRWWNRIFESAADRPPAPERPFGSPALSPGYPLVDSELAAIRRVLGAHRSTEAHLTEADLTAAWAEFDAVRRCLAALGQNNPPEGEHA